MAASNTSAKPLSRDQRRNLEERVKRLRSYGNRKRYKAPEDPPEVAQARGVLQEWEAKCEFEEAEFDAAFNSLFTGVEESLLFDDAATALERVRKLEQEVDAHGR